MHCVTLCAAGTGVFICPGVKSDVVVSYNGRTNADIRAMDSVNLFTSAVKTVLFS